MTGTVAPAPSPPGVPSLTPPAAAPGQGRLARQVRRVLDVTPRRYRVFAFALGGVLLLTMAAGTAASVTAGDATAGLRDNTGPVLVATQSLVASLAEADAAATAAFLSGPQEDRDQRTLYEDALARAGRQLEQISARIGDDPRAHATLGDLSVQLTRYAGLVDAARAENRHGVSRASDTLIASVDLLSRTLRTEVAELTAVGQERFARATSDRSAGVPLALAAGVGALGLLGAAQLDLMRRSRRLLNLPLGLATLIMAGVVYSLAAADAWASDDLAVGRRDSYDSIELTARIQSKGSAAKSEETLALITGEAAKRGAADAAASALGPDGLTTEAVADARAGRASGPGLLGTAATLADSARERAAASEVLVWWDRYRRAVQALRASADDASRRVAVGALSSTFNGFNISVESVLGDNRAQFAAALEQAGDRYDGLALVVLAGGALAIALVVGGYQLRIHDYR